MYIYTHTWFFNYNVTNSVDGVESALTKAMDPETKIYMDDNITLLRQMYGTKIKNNRASYSKLFSI